MDFRTGVRYWASSELQTSGSCLTHVTCASCQGWLKHWLNVSLFLPLPALHSAKLLHFLCSSLIQALFFCSFSLQASIVQSGISQAIWCQEPFGWCQPAEHTQVKAQCMLCWVEPMHILPFRTTLSCPYPRDGTACWDLLMAAPSFGITSAHQCLPGTYSHFSNPQLWSGFKIFPGHIPRASGFQTVRNLPHKHAPPLDLFLPSN